MVCKREKVIREKRLEVIRRYGSVVYGMYANVNINGNNHSNWRFQLFILEIEIVTKRKCMYEKSIVGIRTIDSISACMARCTARIKLWICGKCVWKQESNSKHDFEVWSIFRVWIHTFSCFDHTKSWSKRKCERVMREGNDWLVQKNRPKIVLNVCQAIFQPGSFIVQNQTRIANGVQFYDISLSS